MPDTKANSALSALPLASGCSRSGKSRISGIALRPSTSGCRRAMGTFIFFGTTRQRIPGASTPSGGNRAAADPTTKHRCNHEHRNRCRNSNMRPEGPAFNKPGREAGIAIGQKMSAEGAALSRHSRSHWTGRKLGKKIVAASASPSALTSNLKLIPTLRSGLLNAGPSGLRLKCLCLKFVRNAATSQMYKLNSKDSIRGVLRCCPLVLKS